MTMKIAEGAGQDEAEEFVRYLRSARGMALEVEYQVLLAFDLHFIEEPVYKDLQEQLVEVRKMLSGLIRVQAV
jgi:four helix bundle protein